MNNEDKNLQNVSAPILDDIDYTPSSPKREGPQGVSAPVLDDMNSYIPNTSKKDGPQGVTAPILDNLDSYTPKEKQTPKQDPYDDSLILKFTPEQQKAFDQLTPEQQSQVIEMRKQQLAQQRGYDAPIQAPKLDDDNYVPPVKEEKKDVQPQEPISAPILDDEPAPARYVPKYVDEDLERAKKEAAKRSVADQLTSKQKDEKESLRMMQELRREREEKAAQKGFIITIIIAVVGVIAAVLFTIFASGEALGLKYKDADAVGFRKFVSNSALYLGIISGISSLLLLTGIRGLKSLASFVFFVYSIIILIAGIVVLPQKDGHMALNTLIYGLSLVGSIAVFITLSVSECVAQHFKKEHY